MCMLNWLSIVKLIVKSFKNVYKKYTKKDLDTQLVIVNLGSTKNLEVLVYVQGNKSDKINV